MSARSEPVFYIKVIPKGRSKKAVRIDLSNRILSWTFDDNESKEDKLSLTVDNWDLANFDAPVWKKGNLLEFQFGYVGNMSPSRQCIIKSVKGSTELTVEAYSKAFLINKFARSRVFEKKTRSQVIKQIAKEHGYDQNQQQITDTKEVFPFITQPGITDAAFIRQLTAKQGFEFYVDFDGFHWHKRKFGQRPIAELIWYADQTGTLKDFKINNDISRQEAFVRVRGRDRLKKKNYTVDTDQTKGSGPVLGHSEVEGIGIELPVIGFVGIGVLTNGKSGIGLLRVKHSSQPQKDLAKTKAKGRAFKRRALVVKMTGEIIGDPQLIAKSIVRIKGIGKRLSGNYYVKSHKHKGGDGYDGTLELIRDGTSENRRSATLFNFIPPTCAGFVSVLRKQCKDLVNVIDFERRKPGKTSPTFGSMILDAQKVEEICEKMKDKQGKALAVLLDSASKRAHKVIRTMRGQTSGFAALPVDNQGPIDKFFRRFQVMIFNVREFCNAAEIPAINAQEFSKKNKLIFKDLISSTGISAWTNVGRYSDTRGRQ